LNITLTINPKQQICSIGVIWDKILAHHHCFAKYPFDPPRRQLDGYYSRFSFQATTPSYKKTTLSSSRKDRKQGEGRMVNLADITPTPQALSLQQKQKKTRALSNLFCRKAMRLCVHASARSLGAQTRIYMCHTLH